MKKHALLIFSAIVFHACSASGPQNTGPVDDGGVEVLDSGLPGPQAPDAGAEGAPDGGAGAGTQVDAGTSGNGGGVVVPGLDGGLGLPDGGGFGNYQGEAEQGVRCGDDLEVCALEGACCLTFEFASFGFTEQCAADRESTCPDSSFTVGCDGREDCPAGQVCCMTGLDMLRPNASCMEVATCDAPSGGDRVCVSESDCSNGEVCCGVTGLSLPVDLGVCRSVCQAF